MRAKKTPIYYSTHTHGIMCYCGTEMSSPNLAHERKNVHSPTRAIMRGEYTYIYYITHACTTIYNYYTCGNTVRWGVRGQNGRKCCVHIFPDKRNSHEGTAGTQQRRRRTHAWRTGCFRCGWDAGLYMLTVCTVVELLCIMELNAPHQPLSLSRARRRRVHHKHTMYQHHRRTPSNHPVEKIALTHDKRIENVPERVLTGHSCSEDTESKPSAGFVWRQRRRQRV